MTVPGESGRGSGRVETLLCEGDIEVLGRLADSSNGALLARVIHGSHSVLAIYKPIAFERPLWDFPTGHLAWREEAAFLVCRGAGLALIPPTVVREGPWGPGSLQEWIGAELAPESIEDSSDSFDASLGSLVETPIEALVDVCARDEVPDGWRLVLTGEDEGGDPVVLAHSDDDEVADLALLDAILNNTDRKGSHVVRARGQVWAFDHGITLGVEPKLRTVLWGWSGEPLAPRHTHSLDRLAAALGAGASGGGNDPSGLASRLSDLLEAAEIEALRHRIRALRTAGRFPHPSTSWPAIPWPAL